MTSVDTATDESGGPFLITSVGPPRVPAALRSAMWSTVLESNSDDDAHALLPSLAEVQQLDSEGGDTDDDGAPPSVDQSNACQCAVVTNELLKGGEFALCVEYGATFLENIQAGEVSLTDAQSVLCSLTKAYMRLSEIEHAKATLSLWAELLEGGKGSLSLRERHQWRLRLWIASGDLCTANGEREEAVQYFVLAWRVQAYLHGPESRKCLAIYVRIAELKVQLAQDSDAQLMAKHAQDQLGDQVHHDDGQWLMLWNSITRLQIVLAARQRNWTDALQLADRAVEVLREALRRWEATGGATLPFGNRFLRATFGQALVRAAEIIWCSGNRGQHAWSRFSEGLEHVSDCFPPTSDEVIRMRLRLATLHSLRSPSTNHRRAPVPVAPSSNAPSRAEGDATGETTPATNTPAGSSLHAARAMVEDVVSLLQQADVRGGRHVHLLIEAFEALADMEYHAGDYRSAAVAYHKAKAAAGQLFAPDHERCAILQHKLAESLLSGGHWEDAVSLLTELREWCLMCPAGVRPPVPLVVLNHSLGSALRLGERFDKAEEYFYEALQSEQIDFVTKTRVLGNMAAMFLTKGDIDAAIHFNQLALTTRVAKLGEHHKDVAASYANLAALYQRKRCAKRTLFFSEKCLSIVQELRKEGRRSSHAVLEGVSSLRAWALRSLRTPPPQSVTFTPTN